MDIQQAQRDVRTTYLGGFAGQLVSGILWIASAAAATWISARTGILVLILAGMLIFPLTQLTLRLMGRRGALPKGHPMNALAMQIAFTVPLAIPVILGATAARQAWFYPAFMVVVGAHYLPFAFLYGMTHFLALAGVLISAGLAIALYLPETLPFATGGWVGGVVLIAFAVVGYAAVRREGALSPE